AAHYPAAPDEGEPATADRQAFTDAAFGDIFDVLVASDKNAEAIEAYRALLVGGRVGWTPAWAGRLKAYVQKGGTVVLNAAQVEGLPADLLGVRMLGASAESDDAHCLAPSEPPSDLAGQVYRNERGWVVTLINNRGVYKPQQGLAQVNRDETADVSLEMSGLGVARAAEWTTDEELPVRAGGRTDLVTLRVPPGGIRIVELIPKP